ncbi:HAMP domain-containing protein [Bacillus luteolus]|uniref:histidine kinase n=1 Tax=Litchfieldia luteola TaxID=682179 RepID=A0ABR9QMG9_9BACI|nr:HAMP domain-containing sensor histidine kinase [Cytobacillus luteolus]MBE4909601.1 HAMP domain-containing protein [Cytobacillus luteolus]MBP1941002.1 signal transduction histidine kinase [Cytobacillus luteolus]
MKKGIKRRLVLSYFLMILLTVILFEVILLFSIRYYYYNTIEDHLTNHATIFSSFYKEYLEDNSLEEHAEFIIDEYTTYAPTQIQIINMDGRLLADTMLSSQTQMKPFIDVQTALEGKITQFTGILGDMSNEEVMAVAYPLMANNEQVGVVRFISSLEPVKQVFHTVILYLVLIGMFVLLVITLLSYFLANTVTKPVKKITEAAHEMASGNMSVRAEKVYDDELGKLADTMNFMASELEQLEQVKREFIASISHELRTPLTSIKGWGITLHSMSGDEHMREGLEIMISESERLNGLVNDLLDFSSLSSGKVQFNFEEVHVGDLMKQVYQQMLPRSKRQFITFSFHAENPEVLLKVDKNRIKQVLINVLDNSFKFTSQQGEIKFYSYQSGGNYVIEVKDTGLGIEAEDLVKITNKFYKGKSKAGGSGLGLAICQEIVTQHNGSLTIMSEKGKGTTVKVQLPL